MGTEEENEATRMAIAEGCVATCAGLPALAAIVCGQNSCEQTVPFVSGANDEFKNACEGTGAGGAQAMGFCARYEAACGDWQSATPCAEWWAAAPVGDDDATTGASQTCYEYHLGVAMMQDDGSEGRTLHCTHAAGAAPCVD
jgi:hypothetical protein